MGTIYNSYGLVLMKEGNTKSARQMLEKALAIRNAYYGKDHYEVADTYENLGDTFLQSGNFSKAESVYSKALNIRLKCFGEGHDFVLNTRSKLYEAKFTRTA